MSNVRKHALTSILLLTLCSTFVLVAFHPTQAQTEYSVEINGYTWDHTTISVNIFPRENESWWEPSYLNATLHAIAQWNNAIQEIASNYTEFSYLSSIRLVPTITYEAISDFDVYIRWMAECDSETTIGKTQTSVNLPCTIVDSVIRLAAKAPSGHVMTEVDMQNIVVHELGHNFGLSHSNYSGDVMYSIVSYRETVKPLSSLDLYALSQIFEWVSNSTQFSSSNMCPQEASLTLPSGISYIHLLIAAENLPVYVPQNLAEFVVGLFVRPEILVTILVVVTLLAVVIVVKRRKKQQ